MKSPKMESIHYQFTVVTHKLLQEHYVSGFKPESYLSGLPWYPFILFYFNTIKALLSPRGTVMLKQSYHVINFSNIPSL